jgi:type III secretory pathway component EscT
MLSALQVFTTVVVGVMVGVEFSVPFFSNPVLNALPGDNGLRGRVHGARLGGAVMLIVSVLMSILVLVPIDNRVKTWTDGSRPAGRSR